MTLLQIIKIREACQLARKILGEVRGMVYCIVLYCTVLHCTVLQVSGLVRAGASTEQLDTAARELATIHHAYPSPLNFRGFPRSISTSGHTQILFHTTPALVLVLVPY